MQLIGVDTGGTFTDVIVVADDGEVSLGKALSTPGRVEEGVFAGLAQAAQARGVTLTELLSRSDVLAHGTTVGLNALLTRSGARVGLITTKGFESTLPIAKANKVHGLPADEMRVPARWRKPDLLVRRADIRGVGGRIDAHGDVLEPLDEAGAAAAIRDLAAAGAESLAVCLLWSVANPAHEERVAELAGEIAPGLRVAVSHRVAARIGEYERMSTAVTDAYVAPLVSSYLERLETRLRESGFRGSFVITSMDGGVVPAEVARRHPISTLRSGPTAGVAASQRLAARAGFRNVIAADVGGTSFDVGLVIDGQPQPAWQPTIDRLPIAARAVDIESIGTGGGSIAWIDEALGALRVGPQTASSRPGPACYGFGGERATLTDAAVVLGYVDTLGNALTLDYQAAWAAIDRTIAIPLGMDVLTAAAGIVRVSCEQMGDLIRRRTTQRGHDPSEFVLIAYGGAGPQFAGRFAAGLGVRGVILPALAAGLSAFGALSSDLRVRLERDLRPTALADAADTVSEMFRELEPEARGQLAAAGHADQVLVRRLVSLRYYRQIHRMELAVPGPLDAAATERLAEAFRARYESVVGAGSAPPGTPVEVVGVSVEATLPTHVTGATVHSPKPADPARHKRAVFDGAGVTCPVHAWESLGAGQVIAGPAFVETATTTVVTYPGQHVTVADSGDLLLTLES
jgi:N-methylhydantoinase A